MNINLQPNITGTNVKLVRGATQTDLTNAVNSSKTYRDEAEAFSIVSEDKSIESAYSALNASISATTASNKANEAESFANSVNPSNIVHITGTETITGDKTFSGTISLPSSTSIGTITSTELGYIDGVTSSIQTQLNNKVEKVTSTDNAIVRFDGTTGAIQNSSVVIDDGGNLLLTSGTGALGYRTGAGGTVTQLTSKSTAVALNKPTGRIYTSNTALAAGASATFVVYNSLVVATDVIVPNGGYATVDPANYKIEVSRIIDGYFLLKVTNISGGSLSESVAINYTLIKGAVA